MKRILVIAAVVVAFTSACKNKAAEVNASNDTIAVTSEEATIITADTVAVLPDTAVAEGDTITVSGKVTGITTGKDGYMAKIETADGKPYTVTVSIINLKNPRQFKSAAVGQEITATGEVFMLGEDTGVKATSIDVKK